MSGNIGDGDHVTVEPFAGRAPRVGDIVLVRCRGHEYPHLITAVQSERYLIGNHPSGINGWVGRRAIFGRATRIQRALRPHSTRQPYVLPPIRMVIGYHPA